MRAERPCLFRSTSTESPDVVYRIAFRTTFSIQSVLFGVRATDPGTIGAAVLLMVGAAIAAGLVPAYRASRVNPIVALRSE